MEGFRMKTHSLVLLITITLLTVINCSADGGNPALPPNNDYETGHRITVSDNRILLNVGEVHISEDRQTVEVIPNRDLAMHLNILPFIELCPDCIWFSDFIIYDANDFSCDIKLKHPLPDLPQYTVFDMRFIFITDANYTFPGSGKRVSFNGSNPRIMNPAGFTTLFNPTDFPYNEKTPILTYFPGIISNGDDFSATLNPFIAFGRENPRRMIESGEEDHRRAQLNIPSGPLKFGYAVDACWMEIDTWNDPVNDFPPEANCHEAYFVDASMDSWPGSGGSEPIKVLVNDHQGISTINKVTVEAPGLFNGVVELTQSTGGENSAEYTGTILNDLGGTADNSPLLIRVVDTEVDEFSGQIDAWQVEYGTTLEEDGNLIWAKSAGGDMAKGYAITTLSDNSIVVTGIFYATAIFGKGEPNQTVLISVSLQDIFVARYNPDGTLAWAKSAGGGVEDEGYGITALSDDSTVVTGRFRGWTTFGEGEPNETILTSSEHSNIFVARYNPDGTLAWAKSAGGSTYPGDIGYAITALSDDSTVITGYFRGSATFGEGESNQTQLTSEGNNDNIFVARYNPDGTLAWAKSAGGSTYPGDIGYAITALSDNSTVVTGSYIGPATFGKDETNQTVLLSFHGGFDGNDIFVAQYNQDGTLAWAKRAGGVGFDRGYGITALSNDSTVVTGQFGGSAIFGEGEPNETVLNALNSCNIFIAWYNPDGTLAWAKGAVETDWTLGNGITTLSDNSTVLSGGFRESATFGKGDPNQTVLTSDGDYDVFVVRYDPDGMLVWAKRAGGSKKDYGYGITALSDDSTVITGRFSGFATFGEGEPYETLLTSGAGFDIFVARYNP